MIAQTSSAQRPGDAHRRTPLALFVYNRPEHTRRALDAIARLERLDEVDLIIFSDAPKRAEHANAVASVRALLQTHPLSMTAKVIERRENHGLARSIGGEVTTLTKAYGRVIVLEDDLVPTPDFLSFMLEGLDRYAEDPAVMQVAGCLLPGTLQARCDGLFLPLTTTWGWATWDRAWQAFAPVGDADRATLNSDESLRRRFTAEGAVDYVAMLDDRIAGRNDSWGILWWFAVARSAGLVLYPRVSLIWNGGFDNSGVHCGGDEVFQAMAPDRFTRARLTSPLSLPERSEIDYAAWSTLLNFLRGNSSAPAPRGWRRAVRGTLWAALARFAKG